MKDKRAATACVFCEQQKDDDDAKNYILRRFEYCFVNLNLFPYNAGHVMIIPYRHTAHLHALSQSARTELIEAVSLSTQVIKKILKPAAFNVGANIGGKAAGGSIARHLHMHVVPRWIGDTSFLTTISDVKPISVDLQKLYDQLYTAFQSL